MFRITVDSAGQRIDNFLIKELKGVPHSHIYKIIRSGQVRVNKRRVKAFSRLNEGDEVRLPPVRILPTPSASEAIKQHLAIKMTLPLLFEDEYFLAVDKPSGVAAHGVGEGSLGAIEYFRLQRPEAQFLELVHRLDKDTSGILLIAKTREALLSFHAMLREARAFHKKYLLAVAGHWPKHLQVIDAPLSRQVLARGTKVVYADFEKGKPSKTYFRVLSAGFVVSGNKNYRCSIVEAKPLTGRTHQIRVHARFGKCPILGDSKYGDHAINDSLCSSKVLSRMFLHASELQFMHPVSQKPISLCAPLPSSLLNFVKLSDLAFDKLAATAFHCKL